MDPRATLRRLGYAFTEEEFELMNEQEPVNKALYRPAELYKMPLIVLENVRDMTEVFTAMDYLVRVMDQTTATLAFMQTSQDDFDNQLPILDTVAMMRLMQDGPVLGLGLFEICARQTLRNSIAYTAWMDHHVSIWGGPTEFLQELAESVPDVESTLPIILEQLPDEFFTQKWRVTARHNQASGAKSMMQAYAFMINGSRAAENSVIVTTFETFMRRTPGHMFVKADSKPYKWFKNIITALVIGRPRYDNDDIRVRVIDMLYHKLSSETQFDLRAYIRAIREDPANGYTVMPPVREYLDTTTFVKGAW